ncbi:MAG: Fe-S cluster assembly protein IscX [Anaerolineae bacterium]|nr:Fe-S cluster assembly protein IscX [Anaerolineae bacterium]
MARADMDSPEPLYWESSYAIVLSLIEHHPGADLDALGLGQLHTWIVALPGFADDPGWVHDDLLTAILRDWYEEVIDLHDRQ